MSMKMIKKSLKSENILLVILLALCVVPLLAGTYRLWLIVNGSALLDNARFQRDPLPVIFHIIAMAIYGPLGATQFSSSLRWRWIRYHQRIGGMLLMTGVTIALSGLWMTQFYPRVGYDSTAVYLLRWGVGLGILFSLAMGLLRLRYRQFAEHSHWMMRAYALAMGAGTQVLTHIPLLLFPQLQGEIGRALSMAAGWLINWILVEWFIYKKKQDGYVKPGGYL